MFLTENDYITVAGRDSLKVLQQNDEENLERAERAAVDEIKGYVGTRYDADAVFNKKGDDRSDIIVMRAVDIALYHLVSSMPNRMGYEIREIRYKRAIEWLQELQQGKITADLPTKTGPNGEEDYYNPIRCNPGQKHTYDW